MLISKNVLADMICQRYDITIKIWTINIFYEDNKELLSLCNDLIRDQRDMIVIYEQKLINKIIRPTRLKNKYYR